ncbi:histone deacetylase 2, putative [Plasmodium chabaudi chabaudi]|uniref:histone deacetylase n=1 Tax=Plasmodium chabaudi chabaudi TaxID=31271 RepID=A0A1D3S081_PLACU|nr:histone deacetylase 2, putative [Plasmodium chabaudi chabaudi]
MKKNDSSNNEKKQKKNNSIKQDSTTNLNFSKKRIIFNNLIVDNFRNINDINNYLRNSSLNSIGNKNKNVINDKYADNYLKDNKKKKSRNYNAAIESVEKNLSTISLFNNDNNESIFNNSISAIIKRSIKNNKKISNDLKRVLKKKGKSIKKERRKKKHKHITRKDKDKKKKTKKNISIIKKKTKKYNIRENISTSGTISNSTKKSHRKHKKHKKINFQSSSNNEDGFSSHKHALDKIYGSLKNNNSSIDPVIKNFYIECENNNIISTDEYSNYYKPPSDIYDNDNYIHNKYQISNIYANGKDTNNNFNSYIKRKKNSKKIDKFEHSENDCIGFVCDEEYMCEYLHFDENHVESPDRIRCIIKALKEKNIINKMVQIKCREALYDEIKECHTRAHINNIFYSLKKKLKYKKKDVIYPFDKHDTYYTFHTGTVSKRAVGGLLNLCDAILSDKNEKFKYIDFKKSLRYNYNFFKKNFSNDINKFIGRNINHNTHLKRSKSDSSLTSLKNSRRNSLLNNDNYANNNENFLVNEWRNKLPKNKKTSCYSYKSMCESVKNNLDASHSQNLEQFQEYPSNFNDKEKLYNSDSSNNNNAYTEVAGIETDQVQTLNSSENHLFNESKNNIQFKKMRSYSTTMCNIKDCDSNNINQISDLKCGFAAIRPPGHHCSRNSPSGFCIFNNISVACKYIYMKYGIKKIFIFDWDVHHNNGTQEIFYNDKNVLCFSIHRFDSNKKVKKGKSKETNKGKNVKKDSSAYNQKNKKKKKTNRANTASNISTAASVAATSNLNKYNTTTKRKAKINSKNKNKDNGLNSYNSSSNSDTNKKEKKKTKKKKTNKSRKSTEENGFYPRTGAKSELGEKSGYKFNINVPLEKGYNNCDVYYVFKFLLLPILQAFQPEFIFISSGFDASIRDPLGECNLTHTLYEWMTLQLKKFAKIYCDGRIILVLEGGYNLKYLPKCTVACLKALIKKNIKIPNQETTRNDGNNLMLNDQTNEEDQDSKENNNNNESQEGQLNLENDNLSDKPMYTPTDENTNMHATNNDDSQLDKSQNDIDMDDDGYASPVINKMNETNSSLENEKLTNLKNDSRKISSTYDHENFYKFNNLENYPKKGDKIFNYYCENPYPSNKKKKKKKLFTRGKLHYSTYKVIKYFLSIFKGEPYYLNVNLPPYNKFVKKKGLENDSSSNLGHKIKFYDEIYNSSDDNSYGKEILSGYTKKKIKELNMYNQQANEFSSLSSSPSNISNSDLYFSNDDLDGTDTNSYSSHYSMQKIITLNKLKSKINSTINNSSSRNTNKKYKNQINEMGFSNSINNHFDKNNEFYDLTNYIDNDFLMNTSNKKNESKSKTKLSKRIIARNSRNQANFQNSNKMKKYNYQCHTISNVSKYNGIHRYINGDLTNIKYSQDQLQNSFAMYTQSKKGYIFFYGSGHKNQWVLPVNKKLTKIIKLCSKSEAFFYAWLYLCCDKKICITNTQENYSSILDDNITVEGTKLNKDFSDEEIKLCKELLKFTVPCYQVFLEENQLMQLGRVEELYESLDEAEHDGVKSENDNSYQYNEHSNNGSVNNDSRQNNMDDNKYETYETQSNSDIKENETPNDPEFYESKIMENENVDNEKERNDFYDVIEDSEKEEGEYSEKEEGEYSEKENDEYSEKEEGEYSEKENDENSEKENDENNSAPINIDNNNDLIDDTYENKNDIEKKIYINKLKTAICLRNVLSTMRHPCAMDIKMGIKLYGDNCDEESIQKKIEKAKNRSCLSHGFHLTSLIGWNKKKKQPFFISKEDAHLIKNDDKFVEAFLSYFLACDNIQLSVFLLKKVLIILEHMKVFFENQSYFAFCGSSLLFVFDSDPSKNKFDDKNNDENANNSDNSNAENSNNDNDNAFTSGHESDKSESSKEQNYDHEEEKKTYEEIFNFRDHIQKQFEDSLTTEEKNVYMGSKLNTHILKSASVYIIDFAHASLDKKEQDQGFLLGITSLHRIIIKTMEKVKASI